MNTRMRSLILLVPAFLLGLSLANAQGQEKADNQIGLGYRATMFGENSDRARFQRFSDFRSGPTVDLLRFVKRNELYAFRFNGDRIGYRDQSFSGSYNRFGTFKALMRFDQIPLFYSDSTRTLYASPEPGVLVLDDGIQRGVENKKLKLVDAVKNASRFDLRSGRTVFDLKLEYILTPGVTYAVTVRDTRVKGSQPWGTSFGFALANEVPLPIDRRTTDLDAGVELSNNRAYVRFGYDGSFFRNDIPTLVWDNPLRITDSPTAGPSRGRESLWPDTNRNTVSVTGGLKLPAHSYATAFVSVGQLSNNNPLIPFTVNSALPVIPLTRNMSEVSARVLAMNYAFTSRPTSWLAVNTRYRQYGLDNRTAPFEVIRSVSYDTTVTTRNKKSEPLSFSRHTLETGVTVSPFSYLGFGVGFTREVVEQTHRTPEGSTENTGQASIDLTGISWLSLRGVVEHAVRTGHSFDGMELFAFGNQPSLRQFDISDRTKDRYSLLAVVTPIPQFSVNASWGTGRENYPATDTRTIFGLRSNSNRSRSFGFDVTPIDRITFGANYGYDRYDAFQVSRSANPLPAGGSLTDPGQQFNDPRRDWTNDSADTTRTVDASVGLTVTSKIDVILGYGDVRSKSTYVYGLAPNTVLAIPVQLPAITNRLRQKTIDGRYAATEHVSLGLTYRFDQYEAEDFAFNPRNDLAEPARAATQNYLMLGYFQRPYKANVLSGHLIYQW